MFGTYLLEYVKYIYIYIKVHGQVNPTRQARKRTNQQNARANRALQLNKLNVIIKDDIKSHTSKKHKKKISFIYIINVNDSRDVQRLKHTYRCGFL